MRKLASIQKIIRTSPISGADKIEMCQVLGWECVVKKDEFKAGDLVVYVEIDSILPEKPEFEFLRSKKFRIKTIKLRGQISQGIIFPTSILPEKTKIEEGMDVTKILDIKKYDPQLEEEESTVQNKDMLYKLFKHFLRYKYVRKIYNSLTKKESFPNWISKTDEGRIQIVLENLLKNFNKSWYITEKLDGSSATFFTEKKFLKWKLGVCSRNLRLPKDNSIYWRVAKLQDIEKKLTKLKKKIVIQGEIIGPKIQKNKYNLDEIDFYVFNVIENGVRYRIDDIEIFCKQNGFKHVPILSYSFIPSKHLENTNTENTKEIIDEMVKASTGNSKLYDTLREGIVLRLDSNPHISLKVINPEFLLKNDE